MFTELGHRDITVNSISPGPSNMSMLNHLLEENLDVMEAMFLQSLPMGRIGKQGDIADVVAFLASDDARWVTGPKLRADGGVR
jgi:3-oxoacyl-[acyl-carrier protein] reductase